MSKTHQMVATWLVRELPLRVDCSRVTAFRPQTNGGQEVGLRPKERGILASNSGIHPPKKETVVDIN